MTMPHISAWIPFAIFIVIAVAVLIVRFAGADEQWPYEKKRVLTEIEQSTYWRLLKAAPDYIVLAQVAMSAFVKVKGVGRATREFRNKFSQKYVDFALCRKDGSILAIIEIDDKTHLEAERAKGDRVKNKIVEAAGIPLLRWNAGRLPSEEQMRAEIDALTATPPAYPDKRLRE